MDQTDGEAPPLEDLSLHDAQTLDDLGNSLSRLRQRYAQRSHQTVPTYRFLADRTGYGPSVIGEYFNATVLPPPDKLDAIVAILGADEAERLAFVKLRNAIEERRRGSATSRAEPSPTLPESGPATPEAAASSYLYDLLTKSGPYRMKWRRTLTPRSTPIMAITEVISAYLAETAEVHQDPDKLRARIARALAGDSLDTVLSSVTLRWFIKAFAMESGDAERLRFLHAGSSAIRYVRGTVDETRLPVFDVPKRRHRTVDLREYHYLGPDGLPAEHRTDQVIEATEDGLERYAFMVDTSMLTVSVESGGVPGPLYQVRAMDGNVYHAIDIVLDGPLVRGETTVLNYTTTLNYSVPPPTEMRRAFNYRVDKFLLWIQFHPTRLPSTLWWAEWDAVTDGKVIHREPVHLNPTHDAHRYLAGGVERAIVGFYWEW